MSFNKQIAAARKIMEFMEAEAPQDRQGVIEKPYRDWIEQLRQGLQKAKEWTDSAVNPRDGQNKEEK